MKLLERRTCPHPSGTRNHVGWTSSVHYEVARKESLFFSVHYEESSSKSCERRAGPRPSGTSNQAGGTSSNQYKVTRKESFTTFIRYEAARKENLSSSIRYVESIKQDFVRPVRSRVKGELVLDRLVRGIKQVGLLPSGTKSCERKACLRPSGTRNQKGGTSSVRDVVL